MIQKKIPVLGVSALLLLLALTIALTALVLNIGQLRSGLAEYITQQMERNVTIGSDVEIGLGFSGVRFAVADPEGRGCGGLQQS